MIYNILLMTTVIQDEIIDTYDFEYFVDLFREGYENFMGVSTTDVKMKFYSLEAQIDRYAKNLAFWYIQLDKTVETKNESKNKIMKIRFIKSQISRLLNSTEKLFPFEVQDLIYQKFLNMKHLYS